MSSRSLFFLLIGSFILCSARSQVYTAGFSSIQLTDTGRIYKPESSLTDSLHYRPVFIDLWYPAAPATGTGPLPFRKFLAMFLDRPNFYKGELTADSVITQTAQAFADMNQCSDSARLLALPTASFDNASRVARKFPLIVYLTSYGSSSFENYMLFESLAQRGFVVACISSVGRYPGEMTMKKDDLFQQVADARFAIRYLSSPRVDNVDASRIGLVGYSWGGLAGVIVAGQIPNAACVVSLDGSEYHHYQTPRTSEDADFDGIAASPELRQLHITVPYLRLEQSPPKKPGEQPHAPDSVYDFSAKVSQPVIRKIDSAEHQHFCCLGHVINASGGCAPDTLNSAIAKLTIDFLEDHLK